MKYYHCDHCDRDFLFFFQIKDHIFDSGLKHTKVIKIRIGKESDMPRILS
jgi:hypothetical protein